MRIAAFLDIPLTPEMVAGLNAARVPGSTPRPPFTSIQFNLDGTLSFDDPIAMKHDLVTADEMPGYGRVRLTLYTDRTYDLEPLL